MKLSRDEELFLRHWMYDEVHYQDGVGPAKRLQREHRAIPADLATLIAAAIPDPADQEEAGLGPPPVEPPSWPWSEASLAARLSEARGLLAGGAPGMATGGSPRADRTASGRTGPISGGRPTSS